MKFLDLAIANETIKTTDIKDKWMKKINKYGKPINKAIFRRIKGQLCLTEHAKNIMQIFLFDGVTNNDTDIKDKWMKKINKYGKPIKFKKYMLGGE